jgi:DNA-binding response OmpR family regulator
MEQGAVAETEAKKIFFVEDDDDLAGMLSGYFRAHGFTVARSAWGEEAVVRMEAEVPDVVVLDIRLPDIDGYEVCRRLRRGRRTNHLPVIFLTERRERADRLAGLELGAVDYITKPFDIHELRLRVRNALRRGALRALHNPLTGLPEGTLVQSQLKAMLRQRDWGLVLVEVGGLDRFRERYGFVAADDVTRAVSVMLTNAVDEHENGETPFIGHADNAGFVIITTAASCQRLEQRCRVRVEPSLPYFYPAADQERFAKSSEKDRLSAQFISLTPDDGPFTSLAELGRVLNLRLRV